MKRILPPPGRPLVQPSDPLEFALDVVGSMAGAGLVSVPVKPSAAMLVAGAKAGATSETAAAAIYRAMIGAA